MRFIGGRVLRAAPNQIVDEASLVVDESCHDETARSERHENEHSLVHQAVSGENEDLRRSASRANCDVPWKTVI